MAAPPGPQPGLTFTSFLEKMRDPAAADLVRNIKSFIRQFEERPAGHQVDPEADSAKVQAFLAQSEQLFRQHPVWRGCQPEVLDQAVEGLEKYVMSKVWRQTFAVWQEDRERDERYQRLMQALDFVDLPTLMGANVEPDSNLLALAQSELLKMDRYKAPRDKLLCLVNVKTMVENIVQLAAKGGANIGGADAFFPVFLFVVMRSRLPHLASNVEYVKRFRSRARLSGQFDYMLCNLESAAMYLDTVNYEHLAVSQETFLAHLAAAGIPEAHMELQRMQQQHEQQQQAAADMGAEYGGSGDGLLEQVQPVAAQASAGEAVGTAGGAETRDSGADDVLAGLQLMDGGALLPADDRTSSGGAVAGLDPVLDSRPVTPQDPTQLASSGGEAADGGRASSLTPLAEPAAPSPVLLEPAGVAGAGGGGADIGTAEPRELSFVDTALQQALVAAQEQEQGAAQQYAEAGLVEEMVAEGTRHVLAAEAAGQLQQRYPYMYAQAEDLSLADVQALLVGYKELLLRYEALSRAFQQQLGLAGSADSTAALAGSGTAHRSKLEQQQYGFGSLVLPEADGGGSLGQGGYAHSAPLAVPSRGASAASPQDASPSGKWSPGGILHRITSSRTRRTLTPPKDSDGSRGAEDSTPLGQAGRLRSLARLSPSKQPGQHAFFSALFPNSTGSSPKVVSAVQQQQQHTPEQTPEQPSFAPPQQALAELSAHGNSGDAAALAPTVALQRQPAAGSTEASAEVTVAEQTSQPCPAAAPQPAGGGAATAGSLLDLLDQPPPPVDVAAGTLIHLESTSAGGEAAGTPAAGDLRQLTSVESEAAADAAQPPCDTRPSGMQPVAAHGQQLEPAGEQKSGNQPPESLI